MFACNVLLLVSTALVGGGLLGQFRRRARDRPCTFFWGVLFLVLFVVLPLLSNIIYGPALVPQAWKRDWITGDSIYLIYGMGAVTYSIAYLIVSMPLVGGTTAKASAASGGSRGSWSFEWPADEAVMLGLIGWIVLLGIAVFMIGAGVSVIDMLRGGRFVHYERGTVNLPVISVGQKMVGLVVVYAYLDSKEGFPRRLLSVLVYAGILAFVVATGGRKWVVLVISGGLAGFYDRKGRVEVSFRAAGALALAGLVILGWQAVRYMDLLGPEVVAEMAYRFSRRLPTLLWEGDATYFYRSSLEAIRANLEQEVLYPFAIVRRIVFLPFLNEWTFGLKPQGIPLMFAEEMQHYSEARRGNLPPGLFGTFTLSFGWWAALILGPALTLGGVRMVDWFVKNRSGWIRDVVFASFVLVTVLLMRGTEGGFYFLAFNIAAVGALAWVVTSGRKIWARRPL